MTILYRTQLSMMARKDCESPGCLVNASWQWQEGDATLDVCTAHDLQLRLDAQQRNDTVIDVAYWAKAVLWCACGADTTNDPNHQCVKRT